MNGSAAAHPRPRAVVVGSVNLDVVAELSHFPTPGETLVAARVRRNIGGKGANQAVALCVAGAEVALVGRVGEDPAADLLLDGLRGQGVDTRHLRRVRGIESGTAYISVAGGENTIVLDSGANHRWGRLGDEEAEVVRSTAVVVCQQEVPEQVNVWAAEHTRGRFVLNAAPAHPVADDLLARCDPLVVNEHELGVLAGVAVSTPRDALAAHRVLLGRGARSLVTTLGSQGAVWTSPAQSGHQPATSTGVVDTTGAGDVFVGQLAVTLTADPDLARAVAWATAAAGLSVQQPGTHDSYPELERTSAAVDTLPTPRLWPIEEER